MLNVAYCIPVEQPGTSLFIDMLSDLNVASCKNTVDSRYLEFEGTLWNTSRNPYLDISDLQIWGKNDSINHI